MPDAMPKSRSAAEWAEVALKGAMIPGSTETVLEYYAGVARAIKAYAAQQTAAWREALWLRHGHEGLYGDDGEMQCGTCVRDFKRDTPEQIVDGLRRSWERQTAVLKDAHEIDVINGEAWAERAREAERQIKEMPAVPALVAVAKAAHELIQLRESGSHPGSGGDLAALKRLHTLQDALAHPAVQQAVKEET